MSDFSFADVEGFEIVQPMGQISDWKSKPLLLKSRDDKIFEFTVYNEEALKYLEDAFVHNPSTKINDFDLKKLELEYDYDTDEE